MAEPISTQSVLNAFQSRYGRPARVFRAPARINIIGEHCDYNDGFVMPTNTSLFTWLAIAPRKDRRARIFALDYQQIVDIDLDNIQANPDGGWQEYPSGVIDVLQREGFELTGADILVTGNIPVGGGLSSSASLETAMALAILSCNGHVVDSSRLALMCKAAENDFVGVACGIMDQYVITLCERDQAMMLDCRSLEYQPAPLPTDACFLVVNSGVKHRLSQGEYNIRRQECERSVALLANSNPSVRSLRDTDMNTLRVHRETLGDTLYRRSRHVVTEIQRVRDASKAMEDNDTLQLGRLMNQSHDSLRDDYEVSCSELDSLVEIARGCDGVYGSRMVGAGFGGCTVSLVDRRQCFEIATRICEQYGKILGRDPWHHVVEACDPVMEMPLP